MIRTYARAQAKLLVIAFAMWKLGAHACWRVSFAKCSPVFALVAFCSPAPFVSNPTFARLCPVAKDYAFLACLPPTLCVRHLTRGNSCGRVKRVKLTAATGRF